MPTIIQIVVIAIIVFVLRGIGFELGYGTALGIILIVAGGISSALWGAVYQCKFKGNSPRRILTDFFCLRQSAKAYSLVVIFLLIDFASVIVSGGFHIESLWTPIVLFLKAILVGGVEEIGWRYTFQPELEKKISYVAAALCTFITWGIWHVLFFYIDGTLLGLNATQLLFFMMGLLTNSFILSCMYRISGSLWICVMTHALINAGSQMTNTDNVAISVAAKLVCIMISIILVYRGVRSENR